ncbi:hypothetical protein [Streptomyces sp. NPDC053367]|uniref:hypothetical protein n=1 Tax=Streptomyces sp. NPDC053367 TaxID=3365700 RepID=UPI0037D4E0AB
MSLPKDMNLVFDWKRPADADETAATEDAANFFRAVYRGVAKRTSSDPAVTTYATGEGLHYAKTQIDAWIDGGWTACVGTERHLHGVAARGGPRGHVVMAQGPGPSSILPESRECTT